MCIVSTKCKMHLPGRICDNTTTFSWKVVGSHGNEGFSRHRNLTIGIINQLMLHLLCYVPLLPITGNITKFITNTFLYYRHLVVFLRVFQVWYIASFVLFNSMLQVQAILLQPFTYFTKGTNILKLLQIVKSF